LNAEGSPELVYSGADAPDWSMLWIFGWDGGQLQQELVGSSNTARLGLRDLDGDGRPEITTYQTGCRLEGDRPALAFAFRWRDGGYRATTADYPGLEDAFFADAANALNQLKTGHRRDPAAEPA